MEGALFERRFGWTAGSVASSAYEPVSSRGGRGLRDRAIEAGASELGTTEDSRGVWAGASGSGLAVGEHIQAGFGQGRAGDAASLAAARRERSLEPTRDGGTSQSGVDGGFQRLVEDSCRRAFR